MRMRWISILFVLLGSFVFGGCGDGREGDISSVEPGISDATEETSISWTEKPWQDNSKDAYSASACPAALRCEKPGDALDGGALMQVLGATGGVAFKKHLFEDGTENWDEILHVTFSGEKRSVKLARPEGDEFSQAWGIGSVLDSDHYMVFYERCKRGVSDDIHYELAELDGDLQERRRIPIEFLNREHYELPMEIVVDAEGYIHMIAQDFDSWEECYYIAAQDGSLLKKYDLGDGDNARLVSLHDGKVVLRSNDGVRLFEPTTGAETELSDMEVDGIYCTSWDEEKLLCATTRGFI